MADLLQRFSGNPFSTPVGQKIDQATDPSLSSENWALNMEICDLINETEDGARDAVRAIKKRLQQQAGRNFTVFMYTLTVLETCVKNCGKRFHVLVTNKDFVQDLVKLIGPKNDPPPVVQEKVLSLIQSWAEAFHGQPELQGVSAVYTELRSKGIEFPKSTSEPKVPIHTPQRSTSRTGELTSSPPNIKMNFQKEVARAVSPSKQSGMPTSRPGTSEIYPIHLTPEQLNKLKTELEMVQGNMKVFSEMLTELNPGQEHKDDWDLLVELQTTLHTMQKRVVDLIEKVANEEVTNELLRINDELNNLFMRFDRYQKKRPHTESDVRVFPSTSQVPGTSAVASTSHSQVKSLIDFTDDEPDLTSSVSNLKIQQSEPIKRAGNENAGDMEFDMFAQQRSTTLNTAQASNVSQDLFALDSVASSRGQSMVTSGTTKPQSQEKELEEMEQWFNSRPGEPSITFEQFLEQRANALEQQPLKKSNANQDTSLI